MITTDIENISYLILLYIFLTLCYLYNICRNAKIINKITRLIAPSLIVSELCYL